MEPGRVSKYKTRAVAELADMVGGVLEGDGNVLIRGVNCLTGAQKGEISFVENRCWADHIRYCKASALVVGPGLETSFRPLIRVQNPRVAFIKIMEAMVEHALDAPVGVHSSASLGRGARLGKDVSIQAHAAIMEGAVVGDHVVIAPGVVVGAYARIGDGAMIYSNVTIGDGVWIGRRVIIHSGADIGYGPGAQHRPHADAVIILEDDVEIGAKCAVSRGEPGRPTRIGAGTKTDNLVRIGASAQTGKHCILVAQVSLESGATLEDNVTIAGQSTLSPNVRVGAGAVVAARSVVTTDLPGGKTYSGFPAREHRHEMRFKAHTNQLPAAESRLAHLERLLKQQAIHAAEQRKEAGP